MYAQIASLVNVDCGTRCSPRIIDNKKVCTREEDSTDVEVAVRSLSDLVSEQEQARRAELETIKSIFIIPGAPKVSSSQCSPNKGFPDEVFTSMVNLKETQHPKTRSRIKIPS